MGWGVEPISASVQKLCIRQICDRVVGRVVTNIVAQTPLATLLSFASRTILEIRNKCSFLTCKAKALRAGIGIIAATKKANMLLTDVRSTLTPVLFKHSPVCS